MRIQVLDFSLDLLIPHHCDSGPTQDWANALVCQCEIQKRKRNGMIETCESCYGYKYLEQDRTRHLHKAMSANLVAKDAGHRCHGAGSLTDSLEAACRTCWLHLMSHHVRRVRRVVADMECTSHLTVSKATLLQINQGETATQSPGTAMATTYQTDRMVDTVAHLVGLCTKSDDAYPSKYVWRITAGRSINITRDSGEKVMMHEERAAFFERYYEMLCGQAAMISQCMQLATTLLLELARAGRCISGHKIEIAEKEEDCRGTRLHHMWYCQPKCSDIWSAMQGEDIHLIGAVSDWSGWKHWNLIMLCHKAEAVLWYDPAGRWDADLRMPATAAHELDQLASQYVCWRTCSPKQRHEVSCGSDIVRFVATFICNIPLDGCTSKIMPPLLAAIAASAMNTSLTRTASKLTKQPHARSEEQEVGRTLQGGHMLEDLICEQHKHDKPLNQPPFVRSTASDLHPLLQAVILLTSRPNSTYFDSVSTQMPVSDILCLQLPISNEIQFLIATNLLSCGKTVVPLSENMEEGMTRRSVIRAIAKSQSACVLWVSLELDYTVAICQWTNNGYTTTVLPEGTTRYGIDLQREVVGRWLYVCPIKRQTGCQKDEEAPSYAHNDERWV